MTMTKLLVAALVLSAAAGCGSSAPEIEQGPVPEQMQILENAVFEGVADAQERANACTMLFYDATLDDAYAVSRTLITRQGLTPDDITIEWFWEYNCHDRLEELRRAQ